MNKGGSMTLDYRKIVKYPPETFVEATATNLIAGSNTLFEYKNIDYRPKYIITLAGLSFDNSVDGRFTLKVDDMDGVMKINNTTATKGIQYNEEVRIPASKNLVGTLYMPSTVSNYKFRHMIRVERPTPLTKMFYGFELSDRDRELIEKYGIRNIKTKELNPFEDNIQKVITSGKRLTSSGTIFRITVPRDYKVILLDISATTPASPNQATIEVERDGVDTLSLDAYCLQGLNPIWNGSRYTNALRVVALDEMVITANITSGTHDFRITYAIGKLTLEEKIRWNLDLTPSEIKEAESSNLFELVEAGLA